MVKEAKEEQLSKENQTFKWISTEGKILFGRFRGHNLDYVAGYQPSYLHWMQKSVKLTEQESRLLDKVLIEVKENVNVDDPDYDMEDMMLIDWALE